MSDITLNIPLWFIVVFLGYQYWPVVLLLGALAVAAAVFARGALRIVAGVAAALLLSELALALSLGLQDRREDAARDAYDRSLNAVLSAPRSIDGLALPPGTAVTWSDPSQTHLSQAVPPSPVSLFGLNVTSIQRTVDDGWAMQLAGAQSVAGWTCEPDLVELYADGRLRRCSLATAREWQGWPIPAATLVALDRPDQTVGLVFPTDQPVMASEIGRPLPSTGQITLNDDGSLDSVYFEPDAPLLSCGQTLWNTVRWQYDASTLGQGRARKPVAVSGASPGGDPITATCPP